MRGVSQPLPRPPRISTLESLALTLRSTFYFLGALDAALYLSVLPAILREVLHEGDENDSGERTFSPPSSSSVAMAVALLVGAYYAGRLVTLAAASQVVKFGCCSGGNTANSSLRIAEMGATLCLSVATYLVSGMVVVVRHRSLWWLAALRLLSGAVAAAHRVLALRDEHLSTSCSLADQMGKPEIERGYPAAVAGLVVGCAVSGVLFTPGHARPALRLSLAATALHIPSFILLLLIWRQRRSSSRGREGAGGGWSALANSDVGSGNLVEVEVELRGRSTATAADVERSTNHSENGICILQQAASVGGGEVAAIGSALGKNKGDEEDSGACEVKVPDRYLRGCRGDPVEAERRWRLTLEWRATEKVDEVLREPQPHFDVIKQHYPHFIHRRALNGCPVWVELPGRIDLPAIRSSGVSSESLKRHYVFVTEYLWGIVEPDFDRGQAVTVLDVEGLGLRDLAGEALGFVKQATTIVQDHYVERSNRMFIINAPSYFSMIWRVIRPMLNERTQAKIGIINADKAKISAALLECIPSENLPKQYGGTCPLDLGESEEEKDLRAYVASITPSLSGGDVIEEGDQVEVDLLKDFVVPGIGPRAKEGGEAVDSWQKSGVHLTANDSAVVQPSLGNIDDGRMVQGGNGSTFSGSGDGVGVSMPAQQRSATRRVLKKVGGALGWAGDKLAWRRSTGPSVAHLGEENAFVYDVDLQQWILKERNRTSANGARGRMEGSGADNSTGQVKPSRAPRGRGESMGSNTSEEMTVLAIQAAHYSLNETVTMKLSPVPSAPLSMPETTGKAAAVANTRYGSRRPRDTSNASTTEHNETTELHHGMGRHEDELVVSCPCVKPFVGRRRCGLVTTTCDPSFVFICYAVSVAVRECLPVWALAGTEAGGLGVGPGDGLIASPPLIGLAIAAGILIAEAGRAVVSSTWCRARYFGDGEWQCSGQVAAVRGRFVTVTILTLAHAIKQASVSGVAAMPFAVVWVAVVWVVAANQTVLRLCHEKPGCSQPWGRPVHGVVAGHEEVHRCDGNTARDERMPPPRPSLLTVAPRRSFLLGDVLASSGGPLLLALGLKSGWPWPFDASVWFPLCLCIDLWISFGAQWAAKRHTGFLGGDDGEEGERALDLSERGRFSFSGRFSEVV